MFRFIVIGRTILIAVFSIQPASSEIISDAMLAWVEHIDKQYALYFSIREKNRWLSPELVLKTKTPIITPILSSDSKGIIWLVYIEPDAAIGRLRIINHNNYQWTDLPRVAVNTQNDWDPTIIIDRNDTPWLAWAGSDGTDDDIYFTFWTGDNWSTPERVNTDNGWPDVEPVLTLDKDGQPEIRWQGYNGSRYVNFVSTWNGSNWSPEKLAINPFAAPAPLIVSLPSYLTDRAHAALHVPGKSGIQSTRLSNYR